MRGLEFYDLGFVIVFVGGRKSFFNVTIPSSFLTNKVNSRIKI